MDEFYRAPVGLYDILSLSRDDPLCSHTAPDQREVIDWIADHIAPEQETAGQKKQSKKDIPRG